MKVSGVLRVGLTMGALLTAGAAMAQGPMGGPSMGGPGMGRPGMDGNRPPMERAFGGHAMEGRWWNNPRVVERLKLTDDQRKAFDQILLDHREKLIDLHANVEKAELEMQPLMRADDPNENAILAQIDKIAQARAELDELRAVRDRRVILQLVIVLIGVIQREAAAGYVQALHDDAIAR